MEREVDFVGQSYHVTLHGGGSEKRDLKHDSMEARERVAVREKMLYEASINGNIDSLNELMKEDRLIIARASVTCFDETPLHIAAMLGHHDFAIAILNHSPSLAVAVDSHGRSPLHLASANGYVEIVKKLLVVVRSDACLVRDEDGRTPLHLAVMKGLVDVVDELVQVGPKAIKFNLDRGETILHMAVKHNRLGALKQLLMKYKGGDDFVNAKDEDGNTILHMATFLKQIETIKYLLTATGVKMNAINRNGFTALDIIQHTPRDLNGMEICDYLKNAGGLRARNIPTSARDRNQVINIESETTAAVDGEGPAIPQGETIGQPFSKGNSMKERFKNHDIWLNNNREALMVTATVIAAMAYQAGLNPPSGVWEGDTDNFINGKNYPHSAGTSIMAVNYRHGYALFWKFNTISFISSLSMIFLLISGLPIKRRLFMVILMLMMWLSITFMALTYLVSMEAITPDHEHTPIANIIMNSLFSWIGLMAIVVIGHVIRFFIWVFRKAGKLQKKRLTLGLVFKSEVWGHHQAKV